MSKFNRVQGDSGDTLVVELDGVADFTAATATANVWQSPAAPTPLTATVINGTSLATGQPCGVCTVALGTWLTTALGTYLLEYTITFSNGSVLTWPAAGYDELVVRADA
jgi:hypothetical protein